MRLGLVLVKEEYPATLKDGVGARQLHTKKTLGVDISVGSALGAN